MARDAAGRRVSAEVLQENANKGGKQKSNTPTREPLQQANSELKIPKIPKFLKKLRLVEDDTKTDGAVPYRKIDDFLGFAGFSWIRVDFRVPKPKIAEANILVCPKYFVGFATK